ncbi:hypothetical protein PBOI14_67090 [Pseudomonas sp. Boi14]|nr:hypothetical protein PBOI14_67090 [Pseudomonas sp. Boi14]
MLKRLAYLALCVCAPLYAAPHIDPQRLQQLANDPFWISIGHYETAKLGGWRSYVSDPKFFLAADGAHHPDAELAATLNALYAPPMRVTSMPSASIRPAPAGSRRNWA